MSKLFYKVMIEDVQNDKCSDAEVEKLLDIYERKVKQIAISLARKSWFELGDFVSAKQLGVGKFTLMLERRKVAGQEQWWGSFESGAKIVKVMATLVNN